MSPQRDSKHWNGFFYIVFSIIVSYYLAVLLHEWSHGTIAWLFGYKESPFQVDYGGWLLLHADEAVPYDQILSADQGVIAALIGISGLSVSLILFILSLVGAYKIKKNGLAYSFFYWFATANMVAIFQYFTIQTFSIQGDVGRFTHGLHISPWWIFIPGTIFVFLALYQFFRKFVPKAYAVLLIRTLSLRRLFLLTTLVLLFLFIYTHGYNPISDPGMPEIGKLLAVFSMLLVPILFFLCDPSRQWVKKEVSKY